jgi:myo-inositol-1(or 4)-monophosphatase
MANIALRAARSASQVITRALDRPDLIKIEKGTPLNFVTNIDRQAESIILESLQSVFPDHSYLGKVSGLNPGKKDKDDILWIVDSLDGNANLVRGISHFATSIACQINGRTDHAVIVDHVLHEEFTASRGQASRVNDLRIRTSKRDGLEGALIGANDFTGLSLAANAQALNSAIGESDGRLRHSGCISLDLAYVAAGRLDGVWMTQLDEFSMAPGYLLIQEAGGLISDFKGGQSFVETGNFTAAGPRVFKPLLQLVRRHLGDV